MNRLYQRDGTSGKSHPASPLRRSAGSRAHFTWASVPGRLIRRFHRDTRGAISVLVLLMVWCLVALIGLVWNTTEEAQKRAAMQTAADSTAHAAATWMARAVNTVNGQNMVISQDAATEILWRAIKDTDPALQSRLNGEVVQANQMKKKPPQDRLAILKQDLITIASEFDQTKQALEGVEKFAESYNYTTGDSVLNEQQTAFQLRQAELALQWADGTYVNGQPAPRGDPRAPALPGPPGPNGEGLAQLVANWKTPASAVAILDYIIDFIDGANPKYPYTEIPRQQAFHNRTLPGVSQPLDQIVAAHEAQVYQDEVNFAQSVPGVIERQRQQFSSMYGVDLTLATLKNVVGNNGPATVNPPLMAASEIQAAPQQLDTIRAMYPADAAAAGLSPMVTVDPISPQTDTARIWHPYLTATVPAEILAEYPGLSRSYSVPPQPPPGSNVETFPNGWGHVYAAPLEHYVKQRAHNDEQVYLNFTMIPLDQDRSETLAKELQKMLGVPNDGNIPITDLPAQIPDDRPKLTPPPVPPATLPGQLAPPPPPPPPPVFDNIYVLPKLQAPPDASAGYREEVALYNKHGAAFTTAIRSLRSDILNYTGEYERFTEPFAVDLWTSAVNSEIYAVLKELGDKRQFLVLSTYNLSPIPQWAQANMWQSVEMAVEDQLVQRSMLGIASSLASQLTKTNPQGLGSGILDPTTLSNQLFAAYADESAQVADEVIRPKARQFAMEVANEWIRRPWAYEIAPPQDPVPPFRGVSPAERMREFSAIAAARQNNASASRLLLTKTFGNGATPIVAYAQGEAFNWNEFSSNYGAGERVDQVASIPEIVYYIGGRRGLTYTAFTGEPRMWRVDSMGGWNWRARLSLSDALYPALQVNDELRSYLTGAGVEPVDIGAFNDINLH